MEPTDKRLTDGPVSTLGTPMALFSAKTLPMGHSAAYVTCERTELVAGCDLRQEVLDHWGPAYGVGPEHLYTDYKEMLAKEQPDIVSVATQPEMRAEIMIYCATHGVKAIYAEKAFTASLEQAEEVTTVCKEQGVYVNLGTNRRYDRGFDAARDLIASGKIGALKTVIVHSTSQLFNGASHSLDAVNRLNGDSPPVWCQATLEDGDSLVHMEDGTQKPMVESGENGGEGIIRGDPVGHGTVRFENGVTAYMLNSGRGMEVEAVCESGIITSLNVRLAV